MNVLFFFWKLEIFDRYFEQIKLLSDFCNNFYIIYFSGEIDEEWKEHFTFIKMIEPTGRNRYLKWLSGKVLEDIWNKVKDLNIDLIYVLSGIWYQVYASILSDYLNVPNIVRLRGNDILAGKSLRTLPNRLMYHLLYYLHFTNHTKIIPISERVIKVAKHYRVKDENIAPVIPNGVDLSIYQVVYNKYPYLRLGFIGRLTKEKGANIFLYLAEYFKDVMFVFAGWDNNIRLPDNVVNLGLLKKDDTNKFYNVVDYVIIPDLTGGLPNTLLESYASGKQVLINEFVFPKEVELFGFTIKDNLIKNWIKIINYLKENKRLYNYINYEPRAYVKECFSWSMYQMRMNNIFKSVLDEVHSNYNM